MEYIIKNFSLYDTLFCGQCFRWEETEKNTFAGVVANKKIIIKQQGDKIIFDGDDNDKIIFNYFDLHKDYEEIKKQFSKDETLFKALQTAPGIRVLRQEPFETLISFIISQNNNIKRISGIIKRFCEIFGNKIEDDFYSFPSPNAIKDITQEDLKPLRSGFREKYILDAIKKVSSGEINLDDINFLSYQDSKETLMKIKGVGPKVADCVLLYGYNKLQAFPMDVWMKRAMKVLFDNKIPPCASEYAGIAQQYIFHYARTLNIKDK